MKKGSFIKGPFQPSHLNKDFSAALFQPKRSSLDLVGMRDLNQSVACQGVFLENCRNKRQLRINRNN